MATQKVASTDNHCLMSCKDDKSTSMKSNTINHTAIVHRPQTLPYCCVLNLANIFCLAQVLLLQVNVITYNEVEQRLYALPNCFPGRAAVIRAPYLFPRLSSGYTRSRLVSRMVQWFLHHSNQLSAAVVRVLLHKALAHLKAASAERFPCILHLVSRAFSTKALAHLKAVLASL